MPSLEFYVGTFVFGHLPCSALYSNYLDANFSLLPNYELESRNYVTFEFPYPLSSWHIVSAQRMSNLLKIEPMVIKKAHIQLIPHLDFTIYKFV